MSNPKLDLYISRAEQWQKELTQMRRILLACGLDEQLKWGAPCYTWQGHNVAILGEYKDYFALSFFKGALLKDTDNILSKPGENTRAARIVRITDAKQIIELEPTLKAYIFEAIEVEKAGLNYDFAANMDHEVPAELQQKFDADPKIHQAFNALTPGRQRAYLLHFTAAKQSQTRTSRIEKLIPKILAGKGIMD